MQGLQSPPRATAHSQHRLNVQHIPAGQQCGVALKGHPPERHWHAGSCVLLPHGCLDHPLERQLWRAALCQRQRHDLGVLMRLAGARIRPAVEVGQSPLWKGLQQAAAGLVQALLACNELPACSWVSKHEHLHGLPCRAQIGCVQWLGLLLESARHADEVVRHHVELVEQQRVRGRQVADPQVLLVGQEGIRSLLSLLAAWGA